MTQKIMNVTLEEIIDGRYKYYLSEYHPYYKEMVKVTLKLMQKYKGFFSLSNTNDKYELFPKCVVHFPNGLVIEYGELSGALGFADRFEVFIHYCVPRKNVTITERNEGIKTNYFKTSMKHHTHFEVSNLDVKLPYYDTFYNTYQVNLDVLDTPYVVKAMHFEEFAEFVASFDKKTFKVEKSYIYNLFEILMGKSDDIRKHRRLIGAKIPNVTSVSLDNNEYLEAKDVVFVLG